jgi:hypothetical protein
VVLQWNAAMLQAIKETHPGPPMCARELAIVSTCMYDACAAYDSMAVGTRLGGKLRRPAAESTAANKQKAVSFAAYRALVDLFPQADQVPKFAAEMRGLGYDPEEASTDTTTPSGIGSAAAAAVLEFRHKVYDSVRPITAIHYLFKGQKVKGWVPFQGTMEIDGADWKPYQVSTFVTPAFPEFISGHSAYSAASAEALKCFTDTDTFGFSVTQKAGSSPAEPGLVPAKDVTLSYATFSDAADQAGMSRRYGGIHLADGDLTGRRLGRIIGRMVWDKAQSYFYGYATAGP